MEKRGVIEIQMHWIFVIIAGAIILAFFIGIVAKQRSISGKELIFDITTDLDLIFSSARVSEGSITDIDIPELELNFDCRDYWIEGQKKPLKTKPVFASDKIIGNKILLWSLAWKMPFKVDTFLYVTSPQVRFVFIDAPAGLYNRIPEKINKENIASSELARLTDMENYKVKFILFDNNFNEMDFPAWIRKYDSVAVAVDSAEEKLTYYTYTNTWKKQGETFYLGEESLLGSFFSDNIDDYNCVMDKALRELNAVAGIYAERTKLLDNAGICPLFYGDNHVRLFTRLIAATGEDKGFSNGNIITEQIKAAADSIENANIEIEYGSCPPIY